METIRYELKTASCKQGLTRNFLPDSFLILQIFAALEVHSSQPTATLPSTPLIVRKNDPVATHDLINLFS